MSHWLAVEWGDSSPKGREFGSQHWTLDAPFLCCKFVLMLGGSPGLVVMGGDFRSRGCGFKSQHSTRYWNAIFSNYIVGSKNCGLFFWKKAKNKRKSGQKWPIFKKWLKITKINNEEAGVGPFLSNLHLGQIKFYTLDPRTKNGLRNFFLGGALKTKRFGNKKWTRNVLAAFCLLDLPSNEVARIILTSSLERGRKIGVAISQNGSSQNELLSRIVS